MQRTRFFISPVDARASTRRPAPDRDPRQRDRQNFANFPIRQNLRPESFRPEKLPCESIGEQIFCGGIRPITPTINSIAS
jgi:hypothetical protein